MYLFLHAIRRNMFPLILLHICQKFNKCLHEYLEEIECVVVISENYSLCRNIANNDWKLEKICYAYISLSTCPSSIYNTTHQNCYLLVAFSYHSLNNNSTTLLSPSVLLNNAALINFIYFKEHQQLWSTIYSLHNFVTFVLGSGIE